MADQVGRGRRSTVSSIDDFSVIADGPLLRERGLFVAEGRLLIRRVIDDPRYTVHSLLVNDASRHSLADALERLPADIPVHVRPVDAIEAITGFHFHRGCLALVHRPEPTGVDAIVNAPGPIVLLEDVTNADNVGGVFRNVAAFGGSGVVISAACCDPLYRKAIRTSMGAVLRVPYARADDWRAALVKVRDAGFTIAALTPREPSETIGEFARRTRTTKVALAIGTEGAGLSQTVEAFADARVRIPMAGGVDSLNLSTAAGVALFVIRS